MTDQRRKRFSLRLSSRDLFWLVLVCALAVGWWVDSSRRTVDRSKLLQAIQEAGFRLILREDYRLEPAWPLPNDHNWFSSYSTQLPEG